MSVYLRDGTYFTRFQHNGKRYHLSCKTADRDEAEHFEARFRAELTGGPVPVAAPREQADLPLSAALDRIVQEEWQFRRDGRSQENRMKWVVAQMGNPRLSEIDDAFIERLKRKLRTNGRDIATVNRYLAHLRKIMRTAKLAWKLHIEVPWFRLGKESEGRTRVVTEDEERRMLQVLHATTDNPDGRVKAKGNIADLFEVIIETGMRLGEPLAITWAHLNFRDRLINLTPDITKSSKPRSIPMSDRVYQILTRRHRQGFEKPFPFTKDVAEGAFRYAKKHTGINDEEFCWHSLRHTFASRMIMNGVDLYTVSKLLGHSSITVTERYSHMCVNKLRDAVNTLNGGEE